MKFRNIWYWKGHKEKALKKELVYWWHLHECSLDAPLPIVVYFLCYKPDVLLLYYPKFNFMVRVLAIG